MMFYKTWKRLVLSSRVIRVVDLVLRSAVALFFLSWSIGFGVFSWSRCSSFLGFRRASSLGIGKKKILVVFLHGGIGDNIIAADFCNSLGELNKTIVVSDKHSEVISFLFPRCEVCSPDEFLTSDSDDLEYVGICLTGVMEINFYYFSKGIFALYGYIAFRNLLSVGFHVKKVASINLRLKYERLFYLLATRVLLKESPNYINSRTLINLKQCSVVQPGRYVAFAPFKTRAWKCGQLSCTDICRIAGDLITRFDLVVILGDESDRIWFHANLQGPIDDRIIMLAGHLSLQETAAVIVSCAFMVSADNGLSHLGCLLGVKQKIWYSFSDHRIFADPSGGSVSFSKEYSCMPCIGNKILPLDNYPPFCRYQYRCNKAINISELTESEVKP